MMERRDKVEKREEAKRWTRWRGGGRGRGGDDRDWLGDKKRQIETGRRENRKPPVLPRRLQMKARRFKDDGVDETVTRRTRWHTCRRNALAQIFAGRDTAVNQTRCSLTQKHREPPHIYFNSAYAAALVLNMIQSWIIQNHHMLQMCLLVFRNVHLLCGGVYLVGLMQWAAFQAIDCI